MEWHLRIINWLFIMIAYSLVMPVIAIVHIGAVLGSFAIYIENKIRKLIGVKQYDNKELAP